MKRILTIGEIVVEIMAVERGNGFRAPTALIGPFPSGAPAIFIDQAAKLGQPAAIVSCVGDDDFGTLNIARLRADGVDTSGIEISPEAATGSAFVRYRQDGQRDFVFNLRRSAAAAIRPTPAASALIAAADHLHVMGSAFFSPGIVGLVHDAIEAIKGRGGTVSFDPNIRKEIAGSPDMRAALDHALNNADLFMPSGPELFLFAAADSEQGAVDELLSRGVPAIVVKDGRNGARYYDPVVRIDCPAFPVEEIDPTGAGDVFGATFVTLWLRGVQPAVALEWANASGALAVSVKGPMEGTSSFAQIEAFAKRASPQRAIPALGRPPQPAQEPS